MARPGSRPARPHWLTSLRRAGVLALAAASVVGCVSMPDSGPTGAFSASPQATAAHDYFGPVPSPPQRGWTPTQVVQGFLFASASYPDYSPIARQYLMDLANRSWHPGWRSTVFSTFTVHQWSETKQPRHGVKQASVQATVEVSGVVQAKFGGSGQFVLPQTQGSPTPAGYQFKLSKVNGQWRIANPPNYRLLTMPEFAQFYKPQDLYFASPVTVNSVLVPYSVFVPLGVPETSLLGNLVKALIPGQTTQKIWLQSAVATIPAGTRFGGVTIDGSTAVVSLGGALAHASQEVLEQVSAQLVWTLTAPPSSLSSNIQSVELVIDGKPWTPPKTVCGVPQSRSYVQNQDIYSCYDPYPSGLASFSYVDHGQAWSRCGSERQALQGFVGSVVSVFGPSAARQQCAGGAFVLASSKTVPSPVQIPPAAGVPSLVAVAPSGQYVAWFSPGKNVLSIGSSKSGSTLTPVVGNWSGVRALSWDRNDNLWVAQGGTISMVTAGGKATQIASYNDTVADLNVAPDGVRMAIILQDGSQSKVELAAIVHGGQSASDQQRGVPPVTPPYIGSAVQLGPNLVFPQALTWYDADNLIVLDGTGSAKTLSEVSVDGQDSSTPQPAPAGAISVAADSSMNALVVGGTHGKLSVSTGLEGPWQPLGVLGQNPAYPG